MSDLEQHDVTQATTVSMNLNTPNDVTTGSYSSLRRAGANDDVKPKSILKHRVTFDLPKTKTEDVGVVEH